MLVAMFVSSNRIESQFAQLKPVPFYNHCNKVWSHRGYHKKEPQNSLASFAAAFDRGAKGVELDVIYQESEEIFIVSRQTSINLEEGKYLTLEAVFAEFGPGKYYWIDLKSLKKISRSSAEKAAFQLQQLLERYSLIETSFVESSNPINLSFFVDRGIYTSYWVKPVRNELSPIRWLKVYWYKAFYLWGGFSAISLNQKYFDDNFAREFLNVSVYLFTINDEDILYREIGKKAVNIILSDEDYFAIKGC